MLLVVDTTTVMPTNKGNNKNINNRSLFNIAYLVLLLCVLSTATIADDNNNGLDGKQLDHQSADTIWQGQAGVEENDRMITITTSSSLVSHVLCVAALCATSAAFFSGFFSSRPLSNSNSLFVLLSFSRLQTFFMPHCFLFVPAISLRWRFATHFTFWLQFCKSHERSWH